MRNFLGTIRAACRSRALILRRARARSSPLVLSVGGDHSISLEILRAIARDGPLGMVHVDVHCDTGDD
jgi:arginase family enzyme